MTLCSKLNSSDIGCDLILSPFCYRDSIRSQILEAKLYGRRRVALDVIHKGLSTLNHWLDESCWDFIIPIPPHYKRTLERGFHFPDLIAQAVSRRTRGSRLTLQERTYLKWKLRWNRPTQRLISPDKREDNVAHQILARGKLSALSEKSILLVDDVLASGATMRAAIQCTSKGSPRRIDLLVLAHTHGKK